MYYIKDNRPLKTYVLNFKKGEMLIIDNDLQSLAHFHQSNNKLDVINHTDAPKVIKEGAGKEWVSSSWDKRKVVKLPLLSKELDEMLAKYGVHVGPNWSGITLEQMWNYDPNLTYDWFDKIYYSFNRGALNSMSSIMSVAFRRRLAIRIYETRSLPAQEDVLNIVRYIVSAMLMNALGYSSDAADYVDIAFEEFVLPILKGNGGYILDFVNRVQSLKADLKRQYEIKDWEAVTLSTYTPREEVKAILHESALVGYASVKTKRLDAVSKDLMNIMELKNTKIWKSGELQRQLLTYAWLVFCKREQILATTGVALMPMLKINYGSNHPFSTFVDYNTTLRLDNTLYDLLRESFKNIDREIWDDKQVQNTNNTYDSETTVPQSLVEAINSLYSLLRARLERKVFNDNYWSSIKDSLSDFQIKEYRQDLQGSSPLTDVLIDVEDAVESLLNMMNTNGTSTIVTNKKIFSKWERGMLHLIETLESCREQLYWEEIMVIDNQLSKLDLVIENYPYYPVITKFNNKERLTLNKILREYIIDTRDWDNYYPSLNLTAGKIETKEWRGNTTLIFHAKNDAAELSDWLKNWVGVVIEGDHLRKSRADDSEDDVEFYIRSLESIDYDNGVSSITLVPTANEWNL